MDINLNNKLKSLLAKSIKLNNYEIKPLTINEICEIGIENYYKYVYISTCKLEGIEEEEDMYDVFCFIEEFRNIFIEASSIFLKNKVIFRNKEDNYFFYIENDECCHIINKFNFMDYVNTIKYQNGVGQNDEPKPFNDTAKEMMEKLKKLRAKYATKQNEEESDIVDIISSVCSKHPSINLLNVGELTILQIIDKFKRLNMIDSYYLNFEALMHGASGEDTQLKHWSSKIK